MKRVLGWICDPYVSVVLISLALLHLSISAGSDESNGFSAKDFSGLSVVSENGTESGASDTEASDPGGTLSHEADRLAVRLGDLLGGP